MNQIHFLTLDERVRNLATLAESLSAHRAPILIRGESGVGKEVLARYIHEKSIRSSRPFVAVNCASLPADLMESELFGYERGAFTGAHVAKPGKIESANGGTFLLDEIGELSQNLQGKLLRVLQEMEVCRLGSNQNRKIDIRFLAATHRDLSAMVLSGEFRRDLFYRLNVIPVVIPPLRERRGDISLLAVHFMESICTANGLERMTLDSSALNRLREWHWPGNIRELQNTLERSVLMANGKGVLKAEDILIDDLDSKESSGTTGYLRAGMTLAEAEKALILKTLEFTSFNKTRAADLLGISIRTLRNKLSDYRAMGMTL